MATFSYAVDPPSRVDADVLVLPIFEGPEAGPGVKDVRGVDLLALYGEAKLKGKRGEALTIPNAGIDGLRARSVLLLGLGKREQVTATTLRRAIGRVAPQLAKRTRLATTLPQAAGRSAEDAVQATVEGIVLGSYRFDAYKTGTTRNGPPEKPALESTTVLGSPRWDARAMRQAVTRARVVAEPM